MIRFEEVEFLRESNNIENVWDDLSLQQAIFAWEFIKEKKKLTIENILKTHKILMLHQSLYGYEKGYFRKEFVSIGGRITPWENIPQGMQTWIIGANLPQGEQEIKNAHISYEHIHPFIDGNGRTGRIFMNWQRIKAKLPVLIIKEKEKQLYYQWFKD